jgi:hypothetical protein
MNMYKKIVLMAALIAGGISYASATTPWLEIKPSYFFFATSPMKTIYNHGGFEIQGSGSVPVYRWFDFYASLGYRKAWGRALNTCEKTNVYVVPFDIGLKPVFNFAERFYSFFAIGPRFFYLHQRNTSPYVDCTVSGAGVGLFLNGGLNVLFAEHFLVGAFGEYSYEKKKFCPKKQNVYSNGPVQVGGFAFGISLGYAF